MSGQRPNLTYLITGLQFGGANIGMVRLLSTLSPSEFDITVVSIARTSPDVVPMLPDHVDLKRIDVTRKYAVHELRPLVGILRETDILVCSLFHATIVGTVLGTLCGVPNILVWRHNTTELDRTRTTAYRVAHRLSDRILADSEAVNEMLVNEFSVASEKIAVVPIAGIDPEEFSPRSTEDGSRSGATRVATIGRLTEQKGYGDLLECAERLGPEFQFRIAGTGDEREALERDAPSNVVFRGRVPDGDIPAFLNAADVYFQPSRWEGLCMTVIEAMACGLPVVGSAVGGIRESVVDGETGYLCDPGAIDCFCDRLERVAADEGHRRELGDAARDRAVENYTASVLAEGFRAAVETVRNA